jgi:hypothetical protein
MKKILIVSGLLLSSFASTAATELHHHADDSLVRLGVISVNDGTLHELSSRIAIKAEMKGADFYRITSANTDNRGYVTATLYNSPET